MSDPQLGLDFNPGPRKEKDQRMLHRILEELENLPAAYHHDGPDTERLAAEVIMRSGKAYAVRVVALVLLVAAGERGMCAFEVAERIRAMGEDWEYNVRPRLSDLKRCGLAEGTDDRRRNHRGNTEEVLVATSRAVRAVDVMLH